jgi:tetratricopeptide (TPR) repeat protein
LIAATAAEAKPPPKNSPAKKPAPSAAATDAAKEKAKPFAAEGKRQYKLGRFVESLAAYSKAYETYPAPALLFNLGQCEKNLGHYKRAIFFFEGYLRDEQRPEARAVAQELVSEAKASLEKQQADELAAEEEQARQEQLRIETERAIAASMPAPGLMMQPQATPLTQRKWFWPVVGSTAAVVVGVATFFIVSYAITPHPPRTGLGTVAVQ